MTKIFEFNKGQSGTLISEPSKSVGAITGSASFKGLSKGYGIVLSSGNSVQWTISSSTITNLVSLASGNGTLRISCGANNTDITITGDEYNNSTVSFSGITTITITATSGTVYLYSLQAFNVVSTLDLIKIQEQFLQASPIEKEIRGFEWVKATDSSHEEGLVAHYVFSKDTVVNE